MGRTTYNLLNNPCIRGVLMINVEYFKAYKVYGYKMSQNIMYLLIWNNFRCLQSNHFVFLRNNFYLKND